MLQAAHIRKSKKQYDSLSQRSKSPILAPSLHDRLASSWRYVTLLSFYISIHLLAANLSVMEMNRLCIEFETTNKLQCDRACATSTQDQRIDGFVYSILLLGLLTLLDFPLLAAWSYKPVSRGNLTEVQKQASLPCTCKWATLLWLYHPTNPRRMQRRSRQQWKKKVLFLRAGCIR